MDRRSHFDWTEQELAKVGFLPLLSFRRRNLGESLTSALADSFAGPFSFESLFPHDPFNPPERWTVLSFLWDLLEWEAGLEAEEKRARRERAWGDRFPPSSSACSRSTR